MKIELTSELSSLQKIEKIVEKISDEYQLNDTYFGCLSMAVQEAVENAIVHGNKLDKEKIVSVEFQLDYGIINCIVTDCGTGFNFEEEFKKMNKTPTGKGLEIINLITDNINFSNNGSTIEMKFEMTNNDQHKVNEKRRSMMLDARLQKSKQGIKRNAE